MNIALTGSHGVGKTTLGCELYKYYIQKKSTYFSEGIPRNIIAKGFPLGYLATMDSYVEYIIDQLSALSQAQQYDLYISDRTLLDPYAYALANQSINKSLITPREIELLHQVWLLEQKQYDLYLFLPIQFAMENDGIRPTGEKYRELVSQTILKLLHDNNLNYVTVTGNPQDMLSQAIQSINSLLK